MKQLSNFSDEVTEEKLRNGLNEVVGPATTDAINQSINPSVNKSTNQTNLLLI